MGYYWGGAIYYRGDLWGGKIDGRGQIVADLRKKQ